MDKKLNRINISKNDFEAAIHYLDELDKVNEGSYVYQALWMMAIISYYRPFTCNEMDKNSEADASLELPPISKEENELHEKLKFCRNKIIAHSEAKTNPTSVDRRTGIIWRKPPDIWSIVQDHKFLKDEVRALSEKMLKYCHNKSAELLKTNRSVPFQKGTR